jgi:hypothetical protein
MTSIFAAAAACASSISDRFEIAELFSSHQDHPPCRNRAQYWILLDGTAPEKRSISRGKRRLGAVTAPGRRRSSGSRRSPRSSDDQVYQPSRRPSDVRALNSFRFGPFGRYGRSPTRLVGYQLAVPPGNLLPPGCRLPSPMPLDSACFRYFPLRLPYLIDLPGVRILLRT